MKRWRIHLKLDLVFLLFGIIALVLIAKYQWSSHSERSLPEFAFDGFCQGLEDDTSCARGDFDGDGQEDVIGDLQSRATKEYRTFIRLSGESEPQPLSAYQTHVEYIDDKAPVSLSDESLKQGFASLAFEATVEPTAEVKQQMPILRGRTCYLTAVKGAVSDSWKEYVKVQVSRDLIESFPCDTAGGVSLMAIDRPLKRVLVYFSSFAGM